MKESSRVLSRVLYDHAYSSLTILGDLVQLVLRDVPDADFIEIKAVDLEGDERTSGATAHDERVARWEAAMEGYYERLSHWEAATAEWEAARLPKGEVRPAVREPPLRGEGQS